MDHFLFIFLSYLLGSFPTAVWIGKVFYNMDVREYGSGNAGATNTFRVLGKKAGVPVLLIDILKGWFAVQLSYYVISSNIIEIQLSLGVAAVIGHLFPIYTGFRGGKGIATLLGFMIAMQPFAAILSIIIFLITFFLYRYVSLSSIVSSFFFPLVIIFFNDISSINSSLLLFSIFVPILALITHQKNIERLIRGEEIKSTFGKNK